MSIASQLSFSTATSLLAGAAGSIPYQASVSNSTFLAIGANGYVLTSNGSAPTWTIASGIASGQVQTVSQTTNATYFPTFVDSNNATATAESFYTTSSFVINPQSGNVGIGATSPASKLDIFTSSAAGLHYPITLSANNSASAKTNYLQIGFGISQGLAGSETGGFELKALRNNTSVNLALYDGAAGSAAWKFYTEGTERMRIDSSGNLGIGTSSPVAKLDSRGTVYVATAFNGDNVLAFGGNPASGGTYTGAPSGANGNSFIVGESSNGSGNPGVLKFYTTFSGVTYERMRINSSGNVGIGATSPTTLLTVSAQTNDVEALRINAFGGSGGVQGKVELGFGYYDGGVAPSAAIGLEEASVASTGGNLLFKTRPDGSSDSTRPTERMRIDSSGNLGLGVTPSASSIPTFQSSVAVIVGSSETDITSNAVFNSVWKYVGTGLATQYQANGGLHKWLNAPSGTAGNPITFTQAMTLDASGNLLVGVTSASYSSANRGVINVGGSSGGLLALISSTNKSYLFQSGVDLIIENDTASGNLIFGTNLSTERMRIDSSGNVGIGTDAPVSKLDVRSGFITSGNASSTNGTKILAGYYSSGHLTTFGSEYSSGGPVLGYAVWPSTSVDGAFVSASPSSLFRGAYTISGNQHIWYGGAAQTVAINSAVTTSELMRIDSSGNVGIGAGGTNAGARVLVQNTGSQNTAWFRNFSGTRAASVEVSDWPWPVLALTAYGNFFQQTMLSFTLPNDAASQTNGIYHTDDSVWNFRLNGVTGANSWDNASGSTTPAQVSTTATGLQLLGPGNLRIGTTAANSIFFRVSNTDVAKVDPSGNMAVNRGLYVGSISGTQGVAGEIRATNEITAYYTSDARLKENIKQIQDPITMIDQIRGVYFDWTDEHMASRGGEDGYFVRKHDIGVIAQEIEAILPEIVATRDNGFKAVKYEKIVPLLIEAIKAQQKQIDQIQATLAELLNK